MKSKPAAILLAAVLAAGIGACQNQDQGMAPATTFGITEQAAKPAEPSSAPPEQDLASFTTEKPGVTPLPSPESPAIDYTKIKPYEVGQIMIVMYHGIVEGQAKDSYQRSAADFWSDMEALYERGYRLISLRDLVNNHITVEAGMTPVVFTFDDGLSSSFSLEERDGQLVPAENTGLWLMEKFAEQHPDFGCTATFFINNNPFPGAGTIPQRLGRLIDHGYDVGNHTLNHVDFHKADPETIQAEIGAVDQLIRSALPGYEGMGLSYPYGHHPDDAYRSYITEGIYEGQTYTYQYAVNVGYDGMKPASPNRIGYNPMELSRVRGSDDAETDLGYFLRYYDENPAYRYISDGNPDTVTLPHQYESNVNLESLGDKELILYDLE